MSRPLAPRAIHGDPCVPEAKDSRSSAWDDYHCRPMSISPDYVGWMLMVNPRSSKAFNHTQLSQQQGMRIVVVNVAPLLPAQS